MIDPILFTNMESSRILGKVTLRGREQLTWVEPYHFSATVKLAFYSKEQKFQHHISL